MYCCWTVVPLFTKHKMSQHTLAFSSPFMALIAFFKIFLDKLYLIKINNFCSVKDSVKTMKRQSIDRRKYLQNLSDIVLVCKICKETLKSINESTAQLKNGQKTWMTLIKDIHHIHGKNTYERMFNITCL